MGRRKKQKKKLASLHQVLVKPTERCLCQQQIVSLLEIHIQNERRSGGESDAVRETRKEEQKVGRSKATAQAHYARSKHLTRPCVRTTVL